ncbi:MAG: hypothetical protein M3134_08040 [Actinomycetota bacterium]|nr:hypothetical protein [Actinomycetota bacterium]
MDAALILGFYIAVAALVIRVRRINLAVAALIFTAMLIVALILQAIVADAVAGYVALGLFLAVVMVGLAVRFGLWSGGDNQLDR